jgi:hypothetical protein
MNLRTIEMSKAEAHAALMAYRSAVKERHNDEYDACVRGYQALERGHKIISLNQTIAAGGADEEGCPRLAVARADQRIVRFDRYADGSLVFGPNGDAHWGRTARGLVTRLPPNTLASGKRISSHQHQAVVPFVPPQYMPKRGKLKLFHILFEAEWSPTPPVDPALLRHIAGDLWVVVTTWNLTPLEQLVLGGRGK